MAYTDFTLESAEQKLGLTISLGDLFPGLMELPVPTWLVDLLNRGRAVAAMVSEKARSEFIVAPVLTACPEMVSGDLSIFSGQRLDVDASRGLVGECDYILARTAPVPRLRAPILTVMEAKRGDIELGLGQCVAQMVAAQVFNERAGQVGRPMFGVLTTGEDWQFLKLTGQSVVMHQHRLYLNELGSVLAAMKVAMMANEDGG
jgi:hypothetical protein